MNELVTIVGDEARTDTMKVMLWLSLLVSMRMALRKIIRQLDCYHEQGRVNRRTVRKLRSTGNKFDARRADVVEADYGNDGMHRNHEKELRAQLRHFGEVLLTSSAVIGATVPKGLLLDFLEVNQADRKDIGPDDGIVEIAFALGLEQSAFYRGYDWKAGPFARAITARITHETIHNKNFQEKAHEFLFGKGGMGEFVPRYTQSEQGELVRQPPPLRLV